MSQDIARYIEIVGKDNLKRHLKENLKAELSKAIYKRYFRGFWIRVEEVAVTIAIWDVMI